MKEVKSTDAKMRLAPSVRATCATADLTPDHYSEFFQDIHGYSPFPWQERLTQQVLDRGAWPKVIDLPTGAGKTAVLDTAVFALAVSPMRFPRRIVFVIDRRIVVDQVCERAQQIRDRIEEGQTAILRRVRDRLRALSDGEPLGVAALRGGIPIDNEWTHHPDQPWVMVATVDQFGSRLLFRGYGVSRRMRPIHAGLAGNDCLVILDEVHLSVPFAETLTQVAALRSQGLPQRFALVEMSATPCDREAERFTLEPASDLATCDELRRRMNAAKSVTLESARNHDALPASILKIFRKLDDARAQTGISSIGVVVNRVRTARETFKALQEAGLNTHLITGRMRALDKLTALRQIAPSVDPARECSANENVIVVATQAIEVGADFSFDALITECAPIDSLRQRFGRLDRRGLWAARTGTPAQAWIIGTKSVVASKKPDPIYGDSVRATWEELKRRYGELGSIDVGPRSLSDFPDGSTSPKAHAPLLLSTHMDAWSQTNPEPIIQPSVEWFLHGIDLERKTNPDVSVLWRRDRSPDVLRLVPPRQVEFLQVPLDAARSWLSGGPEIDVSDVAQAKDITGQSTATPLPNGDGGADWVRWNGFGEAPEHISVDEIRPGDILIADPTLGGLSAGTWDPSSVDHIADLGDAAQLAYGRRVTLRLDPLLLGTATLPVPGDDIDADASDEDRIFQWLKDQSAEPHGGPVWLLEAIRRLLDSGFDITPIGSDDEDLGDGYYVLSERHADTQRSVVDPAVLDGSDEAGSLTGTGVELSRHLSGVGERARQIADRLGLGIQLAEDLKLAGRLHDIGKVDRRFQAQLVGGDPVALEMLKEPLAKSLPGVRRVRRYPVGMRHEVASVAMIASNPNVLESAHDTDLVFHLVGTHHGWGRPLLPVVHDWEPQTLVYAVDDHCLTACSHLADSTLALDMAERFWRLVERYGYHGLAWLESILRLADHQQSADEAKHR